MASRKVRHRSGGFSWTVPARLDYSKHKPGARWCRPKTIPNEPRPQEDPLPSSLWAIRLFKVRRIIFECADVKTSGCALKITDTVPHPSARLLLNFGPGLTPGTSRASFGALISKMCGREQNTNQNPLSECTAVIRMKIQRSIDRSKRGLKAWQTIGYH